MKAKSGDLLLRKTGEIKFAIYTCSGCIFVGRGGASAVSPPRPTKISAAASPGCRYNPCRSV